MSKRLVSSIGYSEKYIIKKNCAKYNVQTTYKSINKWIISYVTSGKVVRYCDKTEVAMIKYQYTFE